MGFTRFALMKKWSMILTGPACYNKKKTKYYQGIQTKNFYVHNCQKVIIFYKTSPPPTHLRQGRAFWNLWSQECWCLSGPILEYNDPGDLDWWTLATAQTASLATATASLWSSCGRTWSTTGVKTSSPVPGRKLVSCSNCLDFPSHYHITHFADGSQRLYLKYLLLFKAVPWSPVLVTPWLSSLWAALDMRTYYWLLVRVPVMKTVKNASKL